VCSLCQQSKYLRFLLRVQSYGSIGATIAPNGFDNDYVALGRIRLQRLLQFTDRRFAVSPQVRIKRRQVVGTGNARYGNTQSDKNYA
jgi:hypothetical protein